MSVEEFTFSNGKVARVKPVPPGLIDKVRESVKRPEPPVQTLEAADGSFYTEKNYAHPDYIRAMAERQSRINDKVTRFLIELGMEVDFDPAEVAAYKETIRAIDPEISFEGDSDKYVYVTCIVLESLTEFQKLINAINRLTYPTEEAIQEEVENFRG